MRASNATSTILRLARPVLSAALALAFVVIAWRGAVPGAVAAPGRLPRYGGYGISIGPWIDQRPDLLNQMGMDWVKLYDTSQIASYPDHRILFRLERDGYPPEWELEGWERGLYSIAAELSQRGVDAVEIGNEPNLASEWGDRPPNPAEYVEVLRRTYIAFKTVAPHIIVVSAGLAPADTLPDGSAMDDFEFARQMLALGAADYMDAFGYHPYGFNQPPTADPYQHPYSFRRAERMMQLLTDSGVRGKQMWITEFGWVRNPAEEGLSCAEDPDFVKFNWMAVSRETQAAYTAEAFQFAAENWPWAGPIFLWNLNWNLYDGSYEPVCSHLRWYGILNMDGSPLPALDAIRSIPRRPPIEYRPAIGAVAYRLRYVAEAGCAGVAEMGSIEVVVEGTDEPVMVEIEPVNAPGRPQAWTSTTEAADGDQVQVFVDASGAEPGIYQVPINLRAYGASRVSSAVVRGWLLIHHPASPECQARYGGES
jgi:hypothetical protein